jgi:hypothetical protein
MMEKNASQAIPALLTRSEIDWLLGKISVSKGYERKLRYGINRKLITLGELEAPLLLKNGFDLRLLGVTANGSGVTLGSNGDFGQNSDFIESSSENRL